MQQGQYLGPSQTKLEIFDVEMPLNLTAQSGHKTFWRSGARSLPPGLQIEARISKKAYLHVCAKARTMLQSHRFATLTPSHVHSSKQTLCACSADARCTRNQNTIAASSLRSHVS